MTYPKTLSLLLALLLSLPGGGFAQTRPLELKWNELAPLVTGQHVTLTLNDGTSVKGEVVTVREDSLLIDVARAVRGYPKGNGSVPAGSIALIDLERTKGSWGRTMGTVIGVLGGMTLGGYVAATQSNSGGAGVAVFLGVASATSVAGYYAGRGLDKRVTHIRILR